MYGFVDPRDTKGTERPADELASEMIRLVEEPVSAGEAERRAVAEAFFRLKPRERTTLDFKYLWGDKRGSRLFALRRRSGRVEPRVRIRPRTRARTRMKPKHEKKGRVIRRSRWAATSSERCKISCRA